MSPEQVLVASTALHAGFQLTVTGVVYPALADVPTTAWPIAHAAHSRRIVVLVVLVYGLLVASLLWAVLASPVGAGLVLAVTASLVAMGATALAAAPLHGRLGGGRSPVAMRRLVLVDRVRTVAALGALVGALLAGGG